jgi:site-specific recombinase XerD
VGLPNVLGKKFTTEQASSLFRKYARLAGITDASAHTLRHTFASYLAMAGVDLYTIAKLLGHSDVSTTQIYAHLLPDTLRNAVNKLPF